MQKIAIINKHEYSSLLESAAKSLGVTWPTFRTILLSSFSRSCNQRIIMAETKILDILRKCGRWGGQEDCVRLCFIECFTLKMEANRFFETSGNILLVHPQKTLNFSSTAVTTSNLAWLNQKPCEVLFVIRQLKTGRWYDTLISNSLNLTQYESSVPWTDYSEYWYLIIIFSK